MKTLFFNLQISFVLYELRGNFTLTAKMLMYVGVVGDKISITGIGKSSHSYVESASVTDEIAFFEMPIILHIHAMISRSNSGM